MRRTSLALLAVVAATLTAATARADIPPEPGTYVEECQRWKQEAADEYCELRGADFHDVWGCWEGDPEDPPEACADGSIEECCTDRLAEGWEYRCKTYGASVFEAMWCRTRVAGDPTPEEETVDCLASAQQQDGEACIDCSAGLAAEETCTEEKDDRFTQRCALYLEGDIDLTVWCRPGGGGGGGGGGDGDGGGCAASRSAETAGTVAGLALLALAGILFLRSEARSRRG